MDIIHILLEVAFIPNGVFPGTSLPQAIFSFRCVGKGPRNQLPRSLFNPLRETYKQPT